MAFYADGNSSGRITTPAMPTVVSVPSAPGGTSSGATDSWINSLINQVTSSSQSSSVNPNAWIDIRLGKSRSVRAPAGTAKLEGLDYRRAITSSGTQRFSSIDDAINSFYLMDESYRQKVQDKMYSLGLIDGPNRLDQATSVWAKAVQQAWNFSLAGSRVDPVDVLPRFTNLAAGQLANQPRTQVNRSYQYLAPESARLLVQNAFAQAVGRDPTPSELRQLAEAIVGKSKSDPTVTTVTTDPTTGNTKTTSDPGFDPQSYIANRLNSDPEAKAHQAALELYPALMQALQSPV